MRADELERLSLLVTSAGDRDTMLGGIVEGARRLLRADTCAVYLLRDDEPVEEARDGARIQEAGLLLAKVRAGAEMQEQALADGAPTRHLVIPMMSDGAALGCLAVVTQARARTLPRRSGWRRPSPPSQASP